jgi:hypothetical protein
MTPGISCSSAGATTTTGHYPAERWTSANPSPTPPCEKPRRDRRRRRDHWPRRHLHRSPPRHPLHQQRRGTARVFGRIHRPPDRRRAHPERRIAGSPLSPSHRVGGPDNRPLDAGTDQRLSRRFERHSPRLARGSANQTSVTFLILIDVNEQDFHWLVSVKPLDIPHAVGSLPRRSVAVVTHPGARTRCRPLGRTPSGATLHHPWY